MRRPSITSDLSNFYTDAPQRRSQQNLGLNNLEVAVTPPQTRRIALTFQKNFEKLKKEDGERHAKEALESIRDLQKNSITPHVLNVATIPIEKNGRRMQIQGATFQLTEHQRLLGGIQQVLPERQAWISYNQDNKLVGALYDAREVVNHDKYPRDLKKNSVNERLALTEEDREIRIQSFENRENYSVVVTFYPVLESQSNPVYVIFTWKKGADGRRQFSGTPDRKIFEYNDGAWNSVNEFDELKPAFFTKEVNNTYFKKRFTENSELIKDFETIGDFFSEDKEFADKEDKNTLIQEIFPENAYNTSKEKTPCVSNGFSTPFDKNYLIMQACLVPTEENNTLLDKLQEEFTKVQEGQESTGELYYSQVYASQSLEDRFHKIMDKFEATDLEEHEHYEQNHSILEDALLRLENMSRDIKIGKEGEYDLRTMLNEQKSRLLYWEECAQNWENHLLRFKELRTLPETMSQVNDEILPFPPLPLPQYILSSRQNHFHRFQIDFQNFKENFDNFMKENPGFDSGNLNTLDQSFEDLIKKLESVLESTNEKSYLEAKADIDIFLSYVTLLNEAIKDYTSFKARGAGNKEVERLLSELKNVLQALSVASADKVEQLQNRIALLKGQGDYYLALGKMGTSYAEASELYESLKNKNIELDEGQKQDLESFLKLMQACLNELRSLEEEVKKGEVSSLNDTLAKLNARFMIEHNQFKTLIQKIEEEKIIEPLPIDFPTLQAKLDKLKAEYLVLRGEIGTIESEDINKILNKLENLFRNSSDSLNELQKALQEKQTQAVKGDIQNAHGRFINSVSSIRISLTKLEVRLSAEKSISILRDREKNVEKIITLSQELEKTFREVNKKLYRTQNKRYYDDNESRIQFLAQERERLKEWSKKVLFHESPGDIVRRMEVTLSALKARGFKKAAKNEMDSFELTKNSLYKIEREMQSINSKINRTDTVQRAH